VVRQELPTWVRLARLWVGVPSHSEQYGLQRRRVDGAAIVERNGFNLGCDGFSVGVATHARTSRKYPGRGRAVRVVGQTNRRKA